MKTRTFGPITVTDGRALAEDTRQFDVELPAYDQRLQVVITTDEDRVVAHMRGLDGSDELIEASQVPLELPRVDGTVHGPLTLPSPGLDGLRPEPATIDELRLAAPGHRTWITAAKGTIIDDCDEHPDGRCIDATGKPGAILVAAVATRVYPVLAGHTFGEPLPWETPARTGSRSGTVHAGSGGGGSGTTIVAELDLYDKLLDAVETAVRTCGGRVEYGIVEHHFAAANPGDYRTLYRRMGHIGVDHPRRHSLSGYLANLLGRLSTNDEIEFWPSRGTGYWNYNSSISSWSLPGGSTSQTISWAEFAEHLGSSPYEWPAARLLLGSSAEAKPFEPARRSPDGGHLTPETIPSSPDSPEFEDFTAGFPASDYLGEQLDEQVERVIDNWRDEHGLPKDLGLLRAVLSAAPDHDGQLHQDLLDRIRGILQ